MLRPQKARFSALKSNTKLISALREAIHEYVEGVEDRYGGTKLTTVLSMLKAESPAAKADAVEVVVDFLTSIDGAKDVNNDLLLAISRTILDLGIRDVRIAEAAEKIIGSDTYVHQSKTLVQLLEVFSLSGGDLTPKMLEGFPVLKREEPRHWAHFAISKSYVGDAVALALQFAELSEMETSRWVPSDFFDFLDDIFQLYSIDGLQLVFKTYTGSIKSAEVRESIYSFYEELTGRNFRPESDGRNSGDFIKEVDEVVDVRPSNVIPVDFLKFLKDNPERAQPLKGTHEKAQPTLDNQVPDARRSESA